MLTKSNYNQNPNQEVILVQVRVAEDKNKIALSEVLLE
jgi:hypothetical protein